MVSQDLRPIDKQTAPSAEEIKAENDLKPNGKQRSKLIWFLPILVLVGVGGYYATLPPYVYLVSPQYQKITESIAATGSVKGRKESSVGALMSGTVESLLVREGDLVHKGQVIAKISNSASVAAVAQANQAVETARAALAQAEMKPLASDIRNTQDKILQATSAESETRTRASRLQLSLQSAAAAVTLAQSQLRSAQAGVANAQAQLSLADKNFTRSSSLLDQGAIPVQEFDTAKATRDSAQAGVDAAKANAEAAAASLAAANKNYQGAQLDYLAAQKEIPQARAAAASAQETYKSLLSQPLRQNVDVAREHLNDALAALKTAQAQANYSEVTAPFDGIVTAVLAETGTQAGPTGILRIAEMGVPQISVDLDEGDMADLRLNETAFISPVWNAAIKLQGKVIRIGPQVDYSRGTVNVLISPGQAASWLMPGQTVNVNVIKAESVQRLMVPASAVRHETTADVVLSVKNGLTTAIPVTTGPSVGTMLPVLTGLRSNDRIVEHAETLESNTTVRIRR